MVPMVGDVQAPVGRAPVDGRGFPQFARLAAVLAAACHDPPVRGVQDAHLVAGGVGDGEPVSSDRRAGVGRCRSGSDAEGPLHSVQLPFTAERAIRLGVALDGAIGSIHHHQVAAMREGELRGKHQPALAGSRQRESADRPKVAIELDDARTEAVQDHQRPFGRAPHVQRPAARRTAERGALEERRHPVERGLAHQARHERVEVRRRAVAKQREFRDHAAHGIRQQESVARVVNAERGDLPELSRLLAGSTQRGHVDRWLVTEVKDERRRRLRLEHQERLPVHGDLGAEVAGHALERRKRCHARRLGVRLRHAAEELDAPLERLGNGDDGSIRGHGARDRIVDLSVALARAHGVHAPFVHRLAHGIDAHHAVIQEVSDQEANAIEGHRCRRLPHAAERPSVALRSDPRAVLRGECHHHVVGRIGDHHGAGARSDAGKERRQRRSRRALHGPRASHGAIESTHHHLRHGAVGHQHAVGVEGNPHGPHGHAVHGERHQRARTVGPHHHHRTARRIRHGNAAIRRTSQRHCLGDASRGPPRNQRLALALAVDADHAARAERCRQDAVVGDDGGPDVIEPIHGAQRQPVATARYGRHSGRCGRSRDGKKGASDQGGDEAWRVHAPQGYAALPSDA